MANTNKIYIVPQSGIYEGRVIVFDYVEAMNINSSSTIANHPVESQNQNIADHRFHKNKTINIVGMVSDNWQTSLINAPTPVFQSTYFKQQKGLRFACAADLGSDSSTYEMVSTVLNREPYTEEEINALPAEERYYVEEAIRLVNSEDDAIETAKEKGLSITGTDSNASYNNAVINSIIQAQEAFKYFDANDTLLTISSIRDEYTNMAITSFNVNLRNGPQRGGYWVTLNLQQELIAQGVTNSEAIDPQNSEEINTTADKGKTNIKDVPDSDEIKQAVQALYSQAFDDIILAPNLQSYLNKISSGKSQTAKEYILGKAYDKYADGLDDTGPYYYIRSQLNLVNSSRGNVPSSWTDFN